MKAAQLQKPTQALMASPLKGEWQTITDECMWSLHLKEWRTAACKMWVQWCSTALLAYALLCTIGTRS